MYFLFINQGNRKENTCICYLYYGKYGNSCLYLCLVSFASKPVAFK